MKNVLEHMKLRAAGYTSRGGLSAQSNGTVLRPILGKGLALAIVLLVSVACASPLGNPSQNAASEDGAGEIVRTYKTWAPMFETVQNFSIRLLVLCRMMTDDEKAFLDSEHGQYYVQVHANPQAEATMRLQGKRAFPQGAVIVKEKLEQDPQGADATIRAKPIGLGIMIKRETGFDPAGGNWEYLYVDRAGVINRDQKKMEHCRACHMENRDGDAIFFPKLFEK